jgi:hypothetical protein
MDQPIADFIADKLSALSDEALIVVAGMARVETETARRAMSGASIPASAALALIAAVGFDVVTRQPCAARQLGPLDHAIIAMGLKAHMRLRKQTVRTVAAQMKVSTRVVDAVAKGNPVSIGNVLKACAYIGIHPFNQCEPIASLQRRSAA